MSQHDEPLSEEQRQALELMERHFRTTAATGAGPVRKHVGAPAQPAPAPAQEPSGTTAEEPPERLTVSQPPWQPAEKPPDPAAEKPPLPTGPPPGAMRYRPRHSREPYFWKRMREAVRLRKRRRELSAPAADQ